MSVGLPAPPSPPFPSYDRREKNIRFYRTEANFERREKSIRFPHTTEGRKANIRFPRTENQLRKSSGCPALLLSSKEPRIKHGDPGSRVRYPAFSCEATHTFSVPRHDTVHIPGSANRGFGLCCCSIPSPSWREDAASGGSSSDACAIPGFSRVPFFVSLFWRSLSVLLLLLLLLLWCCCWHLPLVL